MMKQTFSYRSKFKLFLHILLPILATQLSLEAVPFFGTVMSGHSSPQDLVGVAVGSSFWVPVFVGLAGVLASIIPIVAQHIGSGDRHKVAPAVRQGIYLSFLLSGAVILLGTLLVKPLLSAMNLEPLAHYAAFGYLKAIAWGVPPLFLFSILRGFMDGIGQTRWTMGITFLIVPLNGFLNWVFIHGNMGMMKLGGAGAGWAAALTYLFLALIAWTILRIHSPFKEYQLFSDWPRPSLKAFKEQLSIGLPIGFAIFCEVSIFCVVTLMMSQYGTNTTAAHQSALNFSGLLYMVPLSISMALTILVGFEAGGKRFADARQYGFIGLALALVTGVILVITILRWNEQVAAMYSTDPAVQEMIIYFLVYVKFFFLVDAIAAPIQGILRGYKDVRVTFYLAIFSYWGAGLPVGWLLATKFGMGPYGYWAGLVSGLTVGAIGLSWRLWIITKQQNAEIAKAALRVR